MNTKYLVVLILIFTSLSISNSQETPEAIPIDSTNAEQFQSTYQLDFSDITLSDDVTINIGWFSYAAYDERVLLLDETQSLHAVTRGHAVTASIPTVNVVDAVAFGDGLYAVLFATEDGFSVWYDNLQPEQPSAHRINITTNAIPSAIWVTCDEVDTHQCHAGVEVINQSETLVYVLPPADLVSGNIKDETLPDSDIVQISYAPNQDDEAVVRIGRIPLPYVVTSSLDGIVKLWHIETGEILHEVDNNTGEPSVFGNINADATHLVWRDNFNETLYLLNFETGENREIAPLNGDYAQWYFLSSDASVIIAVNLGSQPNVIAWDTATGERTNLGDYRTCERAQPDRVDFTSDGSTLIIGCDTGLDIWQIAESDA